MPESDQFHPPAAAPDRFESSLPNPDSDPQRVLVPVSADDYARRQRLVRIAVISALALAAAGAAWLYKVKTDPIHAVEAFDAGERLLRSAHYAQAIVSFDRTLSLNPTYADAYLLRGRANMTLRRPQIAVPDFTKVIELRPRDPIPLVDRGSAHLEMEEFPQALADFTRAVELDPKLDLAYNRRGVALRTMGRPREALDDLNRAVTISASMDNLYQRAATLQALGQHEAAIEDLNRVISYEPDSAQAYFARSLSLRAVGDNAGAERDHAMGRRLDAR